MKTPREILLAKHQTATPKLDAMRREVVGGLTHRKLDLASLCLGGLQKIWMELIWPSRRIWAGLAAVWLLILAANFSQRDHSHAMVAATVSPRETIASLRLQQQLLTELIGPTEPVVAEPQKPFVPRPGSERRFEILTA